jgi:hypothetical protein
VEEGVDAGAAKVNSIDTSLVVQIFELLYELDNVKMSFLKLGTSDASLCEYSYTLHELAKVCPVFVREN